MRSLGFVLLLLAAIMVTTGSAQGGIGMCCRKISGTEISQELLKRYYIQQKPPCPLRAVVFITWRGRRICSDPNSLWTKTSMAFIDER
uniref:C-C motif chemokine n=1 Tax=Monopterus albus TaxID=43700 RepID=A0A3Q3RCE6_MONAL|nr:monocyte chemotactic protein 1B-like [Monopterus albus]